MSANTPESTVWHTLRANDAPALIDFLVDVVGFDRTLVVADGDVVQHCQLTWPEGGGVMLGSAGRGDWNIQPGTAGAYVATDHVDEIYARVKDAGARIVRELEDTDYGNHEFSCADPEGNLWSFGTYRGEPIA